MGRPETGRFPQIYETARGLSQNVEVAYDWNIMENKNYDGAVSKLGQPRKTPGIRSRSACHGEVRAGKAGVFGESGRYDRGISGIENSYLPDITLNFAQSRPLRDSMPT